MPGMQDWRKDAEEYREVDRSVMDKIQRTRAHIMDRTCPRCGCDLLPVALMDRVIGCRVCHETWFLGNYED